jgi:hypothetical protein
MCRLLACINVQAEAEAHSGETRHQLRGQFQTPIERIEVQADGDAGLATGTGTVPGCRSWDAVKQHTYGFPNVPFRCLLAPQPNGLNAHPRRSSARIRNSPPSCLVRLNAQQARHLIRVKTISRNRERDRKPWNRTANLDEIGLIAAASSGTQTHQGGCCPHIPRCKRY